MIDGNLPTLDNAAGKRRRRLLARKQLYQRLWGGRTASETPVVVFLTGNPDIGRGYIVDAFERHFETEVYRSGDSRAFVDGELRSEDTLRALLSRSRAPAIVFVAGRDAGAIAGLVEHFSPARALWFFQDYRRFIARARREGDLTAARTRVRELADLDAKRPPSQPLMTDELAGLAASPDLEGDSVWALAWYAMHAGCRRRRLHRSNSIHIVSEQSLIASPQIVMNRLFETVGIKTMDKQFKRRVKSPRASKHAPQLPGPLQQACDELLEWLQAQSVDPSNRS